MTRHERLRTLARQLRADGRSDAEMLAALRQADGSLHHTVRAVRDAFGMSATDADRMIIASNVWSDHRGEFASSLWRALALQRNTERPTVGANVAWGLTYGLGFATVYSLLIGVLAVLRGSTTYAEYGGLGTGAFVAIYYVVGTVGGIAAGLMRPLTRHYAGRLAMAYVVLFIVYGGVASATYPAFGKGDGHPPPLTGMLVVCAILCAVLAPIYEKMMR